MVPVILLLIQVVKAEQFFLKFGMFERPPGYFMENTTNAANKNYVGNWVNSIEWLCQRLTFKCQLIPQGEDVGKAEMFNGSARYSGALGRLFRGDFDAFGPPIALIFSRSQFFDYVGVVEENNNVFLTPALTEENSFLSTVKPFQFKVWTVMIASLLSVSICMAITSMLRNGQFHREKLSNIGDYALYTMAILANQGEVLRLPSRLPFRLVSAGWCFFALVMNNLYSGTLTSHITTRKMKVPPKNTDELMNEGMLSFVLLADSIGSELIMSATHGGAKKLGDIFRRHPENFVPDRYTGFLKVASGCCAYSELESLTEYYLARDIKENKKCRVHVGQPSKSYGRAGLLIVKGHPYRNMINQGVLELDQTGLITHWRKQFLPRGVSRCRSELKEKRKKLRNLNLQDFGSAFFILGLGLTISLFVFSIEQTHRFNNPHNSTELSLTNYSGVVQMSEDNSGLRNGQINNFN